MNKNQQRMYNYGRLINDVMSDVEKLQDRMSPQFQTLRDAIDDDKLADVSADDFATIQSSFADGTTEYRELAGKLNAASAPARLLGNHKLLVGAFDRFAQDCQDMTDSLQDGGKIDVAKFDAAEQAQDAETDKITKYIQKISLLV